MSDTESEEDNYDTINEMYLKEINELNEYLEIMNSQNKINNELHYKQNTSYSFPGVEILNDNLETSVKNYKDPKIHICAYYVNQSGMTPFLQYILRKYDKTHESKTDIVTFPSFNYEVGLPAIKYCNLIMDVISVSYGVVDGIYEYKGFINRGEQFYVFYDFSECEIRTHNLYRANDLWLVSMDEIINHKKVCNFPIDRIVSDFFSDLDNLNFTYLLSKEKNIFETPIIAYSGMDSKQIDFTACFGVSKTMKEYLQEPYYYFTDYQSAFKEGGFLEKNDKITQKRGGIVRFALFTGYVKVVSESSKLNDDGDTLYNSIYIGNDKGQPIWALKEYEQQCPLTCHFINKSFLNDELQNEMNYYVI